MALDTWFFEHGTELFPLFLAPFIGLLLERKLSRRWLTGLLLTSAVLLLPLLAGYRYVVPYVDRILELLLAACVYAFCSAAIKNRAVKNTVALLSSGLAFCLLLFCAFMDGMSGYETVEGRWRSGRHVVEAIVDQGFSGRPSRTYELSRYALVPLLLKTEGREWVSDTDKRCRIIFKDAGVEFDRCAGGIRRTVPF